jgi:hypothetical protein
MLAAIAATATAVINVLCNIPSGWLRPTGDARTRPAPCCADLPSNRSIAISSVEPAENPGRGNRQPLSGFGSARRRCGILCRHAVFVTTPTNGRHAFNVLRPNRTTTKRVNGSGANPSTNSSGILNGRFIRYPSLSKTGRCVAFPIPGSFCLAPLRPRIRQSDVTAFVRFRSGRSRLREFHQRSRQAA